MLFCVRIIAPLVLAPLMKLRINYLERNSFPPIYVIGKKEGGRPEGATLKGHKPDIIRVKKRHLFVVV